IIGFEIEAGNREVSKWNQPLLKQLEEGIVGFIIKKINSVFHILVQAKLESGNFDILEMAPTIQCITGSYKKSEYPVAYLDFFLEKKGIVHYDTLQSEEGGRFFQEQNRYLFIEVEDEFPIDVKEHFTWMTFRQAKEFIKFNNYFNIEARSLIACVSPI
nr:NDP-hexose 2,3-dehydratase family protein [Desulfobacteraceae bacterium]